MKLHTKPPKCPFLTSVSYLLYGFDGWINTTKVEKEIHRRAISGAGEVEELDDWSDGNGCDSTADVSNHKL